MLQTIPISSQANAAVSKNPKGIHESGHHESGQGVGDFPSAFAAAAADRRHTDGFSQGVSKRNNGGKADCKEECGSPKDQDPLVQSESSEAETSDKGVQDFGEETVIATPLSSEAGLPEPEKSDELLQNFEEDTFAVTPLLIEEDLPQVVEPNLLTVPLIGEQAVQDIGFSESLKSEINLFGNPRIPLDSNSQNPIMDKENNIHVTSPLSEGKQGIKVLNIQMDPEKKVAPSFGDVSAKLPVNEAEPQSADVKRTLEFNGEKDVNGGSVEISHAKKGIENFNSVTVKTSQPGAIVDVTKEKTTLNRSRNRVSPWTGPLKKSEKFSHGPKISDEAGRSKESKKIFLSSKRSSISTITTAKNPVAVGRDGNETAFNSQRGGKGDVAREGNETALKQNMKINAVTGNAMNAGDSGSISKNITSLSDLRPAMESIPGEVKIVEKSDQNQKDSSLKSIETSGRPVNAQETEAQPSKSGSNHREGQGAAEKRNGFQGKDFHGMLEKSEVPKGEDVPFMSKTRYGSNNGATPVTLETEKGIRNFPTGKENLGPLVRTTAFLLKNGRQEARMALHPESLGHLKIRILTENQQVTVKVMAETVAAKEMLEHNLHQLKADFQNQGLEITKFDVSLSQDSDRNGAGQNPSFASNRAKDKTGPKKEESLRQGEESEQTASNVNRMRHNDAVDFFA